MTMLGGRAEASARERDRHVLATTTVAHALPKTGPHRDAVGELWVADFGLPRGVFERAEAG